MSDERQKGSRTSDRSSLRFHFEGARWDDKLRQALPRNLGRGVGILYPSAARAARGDVTKMSKALRSHPASRSTAQLVAG
jgi:hypothetical protein